MKKLKTYLDYIKEKSLPFDPDNDVTDEFPTGTSDWRKKKCCKKCTSNSDCKCCSKCQYSTLTESTSTEEKVISEDLKNHLGFDPSGLTDFFVPLEDLGCKVELKYLGYDKDYDENADNDEGEGEVVFFEYKTGSEWVEYNNFDVINELKNLRFVARIDKPKSLNVNTFRDECKILKKTLDNKFIVKMQEGEVEDMGTYFIEDCFITFKPNPKEWNG